MDELMTLIQLIINLSVQHQKHELVEIRKKATIMEIQKSSQKGEIIRTTKTRE
jgi:hypothetical protein